MPPSVEAKSVEEWMYISETGSIPSVCGEWGGVIACLHARTLLVPSALPGAHSRFPMSLECSWPTLGSKTNTLLETLLGLGGRLACSCSVFSSARQMTDSQTCVPKNLLIVVRLGGPEASVAFLRATDQ